MVLRNVDVVAEPQSKRIRRDSNSDPKHNNEAQLAETSHQIGTYLSLHHSNLCNIISFSLCLTISR